jgi:hypothetical protein
LPSSDPGVTPSATGKSSPAYLADIRSSQFRELPNRLPDDHSWWS